MPVVTFYEERESQWQFQMNFWVYIRSTQGVSFSPHSLLHCSLLLFFSLFRLVIFRERGIYGYPQDSTSCPLSGWGCWGSQESLPGSFLSSLSFYLKTISLFFYCICFNYNLTLFEKMMISSSLLSFKFYAQIVLIRVWSTSKSYLLPWIVWLGVWFS